MNVQTTVWSTIPVGLLLCLLNSGCTAMPETTSMPSSISEPFDIQGHRGARGLLPENTIPAFMRALELGVTTLEMDVVVTKDAEVVVSHEPWFSAEICTEPDGTPVSKRKQRRFRIYQMTYEEVSQFDCGRRGHPRFPRQEGRPAAKPRLRDVIAAAEAYAAERDLSPVRFNIETKSTPEGDDRMHPRPDAFTRLLYDVLVKTGVKERATIQSFDVRTLQAARRIDESMQLSLLVGRRAGRNIDRQIRDLGFVPAVYSPDYRLLSESTVEKAHEMGMRVIPWTVNTLDEMRRLKAMGVDGLITDYPDLVQGL